MHISEFSYDLPEELIAQEPLTNRDASRMLVVDRRSRTWSDSEFSSLSHYLQSGDVLVINNTRVFPARLVGQRQPSGGRVELLLIREVEPLVWEALIRPGHRLRSGAVISFGQSALRAEVLDDPGKDMRLIGLNSKEGLESALELMGQMPLPPYIKRPGGTSEEDRERYQTIFARERGAIAAPTAGLHFTSSVLESLNANGIEIVEITLHVGYGTFEPVRVEEIAEHKVRPEAFEIIDKAARAINARRSAGGRVVAVGTTTTRALESAVDSAGLVQPIRADATLTITPGFKFQVTDALLTNFHLPRSSLLLLVSAFAGRELILQAYRHAVEARYRFYSYGDCMLII
jgi:S-adenosylmethionine:tRNA ribosyltransferase-isomerase